MGVAKTDIIGNLKIGTEKLTVGIRPTPPKKSADVFSEEVEYAIRPGHVISRIRDY